MNQIDSCRMPVILFDFDINGTIILEESSSGAGWEEMLVSVIAENTFYDWNASGNEMSYKDYVNNVLLPGDKSDRILKTQRREIIANFLQWLKDHNHPIKYQACRDYKNVKEKFTNSSTGKIESRVFDSFFVLLDKLRALNIAFVVKLRTFGKHLKYAVDQISQHPSGIKFKYLGKFSERQLHLEDEGTIEKADQIFHKFLTSEEHFALLDDWTKWNMDGERGRSGKPFIYDSTGDLHQVRNLSLFFDDNISGEEHDIVLPMDVSGSSLSGKELKDKMLFKVDTVRAIVNPDYFFEIVKRALVSNGYKPFDISLDMLKKIKIKDGIRYPSTHSCKIILTDGRKTKTHLDMYEICSIVKGVAREKVKGDVNYFIDNSDEKYFNFFRHYEFFPIGEDVLSKAFKK